MNDDQNPPRQSRFATLTFAELLRYTLQQICSQRNIDQFTAKEQMSRGTGLNITDLYEWVAGTYQPNPEVYLTFSSYFRQLVGEEIIHPDALRRMEEL